MTRYAEATTVTVEKSKAELEALIKRYQARKVMTGYDEDQRLAVIQFEMRDRRVMFRLRLPAPGADEFQYDGRGYQRSSAAATKAYEQEERRLWRSLLLVIKAKLESVDSGIESFEEAFLSQLVIPGTGGTYGDFAVPQIAHVYATGELPAMLPALGPGRQA